MDIKVCTELKYNFLKITRNIQSSFRISFDGTVIYIDPYKIEEVNNDATFIFISHEHSDHFDWESIKKIMNSDTKIITTEIVTDVLVEKGIPRIMILRLIPESEISLGKMIKVVTKYAYNVNKFKSENEVFHPKDHLGVGFVISFKTGHEQINIYHMGDTDNLGDLQKVEKVNVLMIPVGGTYVMDVEEAIAVTGLIAPEYSIPMHFDCDAGTVEDAKTFISRIKNRGVLL